jgi:glutamate-1-semialdehyde 2,1-aminomutase
MRACPKRGGVIPTTTLTERRYKQRTAASKAMHRRAEQVFPGGSISSVRAFREYPYYIRSAEGSYLYDVDGSLIVDLMNANGSVMLGHGHPGVTVAVAEQATRGLAFQLPGDNVVECAELLRARTPSMERMRFTCSGTEATMYALRLARVHTGRRRLLFMDGCYSGFHDIGSIGDGPNRGQSSPDSPVGKPVARGVDRRLAEDVEFAHFNDIESCRSQLDAHPGEFAAVIVEPMLGAAGNIGPEPGFLAALRALCDRDGTLLMFDEMITYSVSPNAAQGLYGVRPDLTTAGKSIANGMPIGVFGGRADVMDLCTPVNGRAPMQHSSSFAAHPLVMAACGATLRAYDDAAVDRVEAIGDYTREGIRRVLSDKGINGQVTGVQHLFGLHLVDVPVRRYADVRGQPPGTAASIAYSLLSQGFLMAGNRGCVNVTTTTSDIDGFLHALSIALDESRVAETQSGKA